MKNRYIFILLLFLTSAASAQCPDIFFSEAAEGSSFNKYLEIYNGTGDTVDLANYAFPNTGNDVTDSGKYEFWNTFDSGAIILPDEVFVIADSRADSVILSHADMTFQFLSNGDDGFALVKNDGVWTDSDTDGRVDAGEMVAFTVLDWVGDWNGRPSGGWDVAGVTAATKDHTLVRRSAFSGDTSWANAAGTDSASSQWDVLPNNDWSMLGSHSADCNPPVSPEVSFAATSLNVDENAGTTTVEVTISAPSSSMATSVDLTVTGGSAVNGTDYSLTSPTTLTFGAGSSANQSVSITITDNAIANDDKTIELALSNVSSHATLKDSVLVINIVSDDYAVSTIEDAKSPDSSWAPANEGDKYELSGIVHGIDYDGNNGYSFALIDVTGAINIFNFSDVSNYTVTEGDSITARGEIDFYFGLLELFVDSIKLHSQGNPLKTPVEVSAPDESTESDFISITKIWIADTTTVWPDNGNVLVTNEDADTFQVRIDRDAADIVGQPVQFDTMNILGIGGQFDRSAPYDEGYQIFPRYLSDITEWVDNSNIEELVIKTVVYPNPATSSIGFVGNNQWTSYTIYSVSGQVVQTGAVQGSKVNVNELSNGTYLIKLTSKEKAGVARFNVSR